MRRLVYVVNGTEVSTLAEARAIQPTGELKTRLYNVEEPVSEETKAYRERRIAAIKAKTAKA